MMSGTLLSAKGNGCGPGRPRNQHQSPFSCDSIWNRPMGSKAEYIPAEIGPSPWVSAEVNDSIVTTDSDSVVPWYFSLNYRF